MKLTDGWFLLSKEEIIALEKVTPQALAIYFHLRKRVNNKRGDKKAFPSVATLLSEIGYSDKSKESFSKYLSELEKELVTVERRYDPETKTWATNNYYLPLAVEVVVKEDIPMTPTSHTPMTPRRTIINKNNNKKEVIIEKEEIQKPETSGTPTSPNGVVVPLSLEIENISKNVSIIPISKGCVQAPHINY